MHIKVPPRMRPKVEDGDGAEVAAAEAAADGEFLEAATPDRALFEADEVATAADSDCDEKECDSASPRN